jgi:uncharacterized membrane protein
MASKRSDGSINLVEQETNLLAVVSIVGGQCRRADLDNDLGGSEPLRSRLRSPS